MIQKRLLTTAILVVGLLVAVAAQEVQVTYQDGMVQLKSGAAWKAVSIGDKLSADSTLKLDKNSTIELKSGPTVLVISQAGTYALKDILAARKKTETNGVAKSLQASFGQLTGATPVNKQSTVAGVRAKQQGSDQPEWATGDIADTINDGKSFLKNGQYKEALEKFNSALNEAAEVEAPELYYLIAYSQTLMGEIRPALKQLANVKAVPEADWAGDYILLKARLLEEGFAWTEAISWLTKQGASLATDVNRGPLYHFLLGLAYSSSGDSANAKTSLNTVISLGKDTDLGKAAAALLQN